MSDGAAQFWAGFVMGAVLGVMVMGVIYQNPKRKCEAELPRNVECVWAAPTAQEPTP